MAASSKKIQQLVEDLESDSRRSRQSAALELLDCCSDNASAVLAEGDALVDALELSEARTRWAVLETLNKLCPQDPALCEKALPGIENALFDETSGPLHLASFKLLCTYCALSEECSDKVWPLLDEAIQCFHGDQEFPDMLNLLLALSEGNLSEATKKAFADRMTFDAQNNKGVVKRKSQTIVDNLSK